MAGDVVVGDAMSEDGMVRTRRHGIHIGARGRALVALIVFCMAGGALLSRAEAAPGAYHEDKKLGYAVKSPRNWRYIAMSADEKWIAAKFLSDKACFWTDKETGMSAEFKPVMQVIVFVDEVIKKKVETEESEDGSVIFKTLHNPFKNYQDFLKDTYRGGGWYVSAEEAGKHRDIDVTKYEIKVEKLTYTGPKRIVTWVFHTPDVDFAVQFEVLEGDYKKFKGDIHACLKSFKTIKREAPLTTDTTGKKIRNKPEEDLTQEERTAQRKRTEKELHEKVQSNLPDDWKVKKMGRFLVLNHADEKYAKKTVAHAEAVWKWLDKRFDYIGKGEYVRQPILRICADRDEENAFRSGTSWGDSLEIVTHQDKGSGAMSWELEYVNNRITEIWWRHRNGDLYWSMPDWLRSGLRQVLGTARAKGRGLEFKIDDWEREGLRTAVKKGELIAPRVLVMMTGSKFREQQSTSKQSAAFLRFLLEAKSKKVRIVLEAYLKNLQDVVEETKAEEKKKRADGVDTGPAAPQTEEEEEEAFRNRKSRFEAKESEFLQKVYDRTFGDWSDKDWEKLEKQFFKSIG